MTKLPKARIAEILEQEAGRELLVYDLRNNKTFALNETLATIFKACDGKTGFDELTRQTGFDSNVIHFALGELKANNLLENYEDNYFAGLSRRDVIKKVGFASMVALPVISSLVAPTALNAASPVSCVSNADCPPPSAACQFNICDSGICTAVPAAAGSPSGNGLVCDGSGNAVQCVTSTDCAGADTACRTRTCTANICGFSFAPPGTPAPGGVCDGAGNVVTT